MMAFHQEHDPQQSFDAWANACEMEEAHEDAYEDLEPNYDVPCGARLAALSGEQRRHGYGAYGLEALTRQQVGEMIYRVYSHKHYGIVRAPWRLRLLIAAFEREAIMMTGGFDD